MWSMGLHGLAFLRYQALALIDHIDHIRHIDHINNTAMFKIRLISMLFFISASVIAQGNLVIDSIHIPVRVIEQTITLQTGKNTVLEIPVGQGDTTVMFNPETYGEQVTIFLKGPSSRPIQVKDLSLKLKRSQFLKYPLLYLSHNGLDYPPYKCYIYFFQEDRYVGLGFDDTIVTGPGYTLRYFKITTLLDFESMLRKNLPKDVTEVYISGMAFFSPDTGEKIFLGDSFKIELED